MSQTITLKLPDEMLRRYRRGAIAAQKDLEDFVLERLNESAPPVADDLPSPLREELAAMEHKDNKSLLQIARAQLPVAQQRAYSRLLRANGEGVLTPPEQAQLSALGEQARGLTFRKAHAYLLLKWRGHSVPLVDSL